MDNLPSHLLEVVLFKLDPKSLAMMQCTERRINSHISDDPYFNSEYSSRVGSSLLHTSSFGDKNIFCNPFGDSRLFRNKDSLDTESYILGSCSGLLLLFIESLCVVNPITKRFRFLGHSRSKLLRDLVYVPRFSNSKFALKCDKANRLGFAVDQIDGTTQRFRVVYVSVLENSASNETMYQFEISTGDSRWRLSETTITCPSSDLVHGMKPVYLDGDLHWLRNDGSIVAFNPETDKAQLIRINFPQELSLETKNLLAADNGLALVSATEESIYVYALKNILTNPKWVLVKRIPNVLDKERMSYWEVHAYDGKRLVLRETRKPSYNGVIHGYDLTSNKWGVMGLVPSWCDCSRDIYQFKPSLSSAIQLNGKVEVDMTTKVKDKRISSLSKITRLIGEISPYALNRLKRKDTQLGERLMTDEETKLKIMMEKPHSKFMDVEIIRKRRRT